MSEMDDLIVELKTLAIPDEIEKVRRFFRGDDPATTVMGIQIGKIFPVAKRFSGLDLGGVNALLDDDRYEIRMAAVAILDFKARDKTLSEEGRATLFDLYMTRHDRINNWDLVDRAAPHVVGEYLVRRDRSVLDDLAASDNPHERRTAIVATHAFIKRGDTDDTFRIAAKLAADDDDYVQKAIASWTREAGKRNPEALVDFLFENKTILPRPTMTAASKLLSEKMRQELRA